MTATLRQLDVTTFMGSKVKETLDIPEDLQVYEGIEQPTGEVGTFRILHQAHGDYRITWMKNSLQQIQAAKQLFLDMIKKGLTPYKVGVNGKATSEVMREFDANCEEVIFLPKILVAGG